MRTNSSCGNERMTNNAKFYLNISNIGESHDSEKFHSQSFLSFSKYNSDIIRESFGKTDYAEVGRTSKASCIYKIHSNSNVLFNHWH